MPDTPVKSIRIPDDEYRAALKKAEEHRLKGFSGVVRYALQRLSPPRKK